MDGLYLVVTSFADMTTERLAEVARAFDRHPNLCPLRVGGDPARIKVEPSLEAVLAKQGLPVDWLTVRRNGRFPDFESGQLSLYPGRGGWLTGPLGDDPPEYLLTGHEISQYWLASTVEPAGVSEDAVLLFEDLVAAMDPAFACVATHRVSSVIRFRLPDVGWLNYLGPSFVRAHPDLSAISGARVTLNGGVLFRVGEQPGRDTSTAGLIRAQLEAVLGSQAFNWDQRTQNPGLPTPEEHVAASPGTGEMPWVAWLAKKAGHDREMKHVKARQRLLIALEARGAEPSLAQTPVEWSTSMDLTDWQALAQHLSRKLGGDLASPVGRALIAVIASAPAGDQGELLLT
jgi:hypothetical protein